MGKKYITLFVLLFSFNILFAYLFPNEMLYYQKPRVTLSGFEGEYEFSLVSRILIDTIWGIEVDDPVIPALMNTESSFIIHSISTSNAVGPFQMKPFLAQEIGILNPFNPYKENDILQLLYRYREELGSLDAALGAYHIGFYGTKKMIDSGQNPLSDNRINAYVKKNHEFQRLYSEGDWVPLKDYVWFDLKYSVNGRNDISLTTVIPEFFIGSLALNAGYLSDETPSLDNINFSVFQDIALFWFMNLYVGFDEGFVAGCTLKSNDWYDRITLKYDFEQRDLIWEAYNSFGMFCMRYGFSKDNIFLAPSLELNNKFRISFIGEYRNFEFKPGIECVIKF